MLLIFMVCLTGTVNGGTVRVKSIGELQKAINNASPGDLIVVVNGTYITEEPITVSVKGTDASPIVIAAESTGGVEIKGTAGFHILNPAGHIVIRGFKFTHNTGQARIEAGASHCIITRNIFECAPAGKGNKPYLSISGDDTEISYNTFQNKDTEGCMVTIQGPGSSGMAQRTWIHHNYFFNFMPSRANNSSAIQPGLSSRSLTPAHTLIEYNLFVGCRGENEGIVANKSSDNIYRFNTFGEGCSEVSLRHGDRLEVYCNFFTGNTGLRFCADKHRIYSNYFENCEVAINCVNGDGDVHAGDDLRQHDRPDSVEIVFNTLVNNKENYRMPDRRNGLGATSITFANNIIQGGAPVSLTGPYANPVWSGNILWKVEGGDMPDEGYITADPLLTKSGPGIFRIGATSPAINGSKGLYPYVDADIDGQKRKGKSDTGADERVKKAGFNRPLTTADVGPQAGENK